MFRSKEAIADVAILARSGDPGAKDALLTYCSGRIAELDQDGLVETWRRYIADVQELAKAHGLDRREINAAMEECASKAGHGDAASILRIRQQLLKLSIEATHAVYLTLVHAPHLAIGGPGKGPSDDKPHIVMG